jgi:hypothetical protein
MNDMSELLNKSLLYHFQFISLNLFTLLLILILFLNILFLKILTTFRELIEC